MAFRIVEERGLVWRHRKPWNKIIPKKDLLEKQLGQPEYGKNTVRRLKLKISRGLRR